MSELSIFVDILKESMSYDANFVRNGKIEFDGVASHPELFQVVRISCAGRKNIARVIFNGLSHKPFTVVFSRHEEKKNKLLFWKSSKSVSIESRVDFQNMVEAIWAIQRYFERPDVGASVVDAHMPEMPTSVRLPKNAS